LEGQKPAGVGPALLLLADRAQVGREVASVPVAVPPDRAARFANVLVVRGGPPVGGGAFGPRSPSGAHGRRLIPGPADSDRVSFLPPCGGGPGWGVRDAPPPRPSPILSGSVLARYGGIVPQVEVGCALAGEPAMAPPLKPPVAEDQLQGFRYLDHF